MIEFKSFTPNGYYFRPKIDLYDDKSFPHHFGGISPNRNIDCPNCKREFVHFASINKFDPLIRKYFVKGKSAFSSNTFVPLIYCWKCNIPKEPMYYEFQPDLKIIRCGVGIDGGNEEFPHKNYPRVHQGVKFGLKSMPFIHQKIIKIENRGKVKIPLRYSLENYFGKFLTANHQFGGEPFLVQKNPEFQEYRKDNITCPKCSKIMPFFVSISNNSVSGPGLHGCADVQVIFSICNDCAIISAFNEVD